MTVTQGSVTGVLKTALTGTTTSIVIQSNFDVVFVDDIDLVIGSSPAVAHSTITAATNSGTTTTVAACNTQVQILFPESVTTTKIRLVSKIKIANAVPQNVICNYHCVTILDCNYSLK